MHVEYPVYLKEKSSQRGFTLIELIIVIVTMALLFSVGYANYRGFQSRQRIVTAVRKVKSDLRLSQEFALSQRKICANPLHRLMGYQFSITPPVTYSVSAVCNDGVADYVVAPPVKTEALNGFTFSPAPNPVSAIRFNVLGRGTNLAAAQMNIFLFDPTAGTTATVVVTSVGEIR